MIQKKIVYLFGIFIIAVILVFTFFLWSPTDFPINTVYTIEKGQGANSLATDLFNHKVIKSPFLFKLFYHLTIGRKGIMAGDYVLDTKENSFKLVRRMINGDFRLPAIRVTIPEGLNIYEIYKILANKLPTENIHSFIELAKRKEGYLFPDTYLFLSNITASEIITAMNKNFEMKIETIMSEIHSSNKTLDDIIKLASIVEGEARTAEVRKIVSGILWKRLEMGMPLQVDASFKYINGKTTADLTLADLKIDSPYNSYLYKGLPPTPISNPGLDSILATIIPTQTDYLYFLTDNDGRMHYAETYQRHLQNKELYLK